MKAAAKFIEEAEKEIEAIKEIAKGYNSHVNHILQEYAEAKIMFSAVDKKTIPTFHELKIPIEPYLSGLLDAIGELKRETLESLRRGNKHEAEGYFKMMEEIYDALLPLRFSNSVLPEFRRKQDSARFQIEQARAELL
jgi:translin